MMKSTPLERLAYSKENLYDEKRSNFSREGKYNFYCEECVRSRKLPPDILVAKTGIYLIKHRNIYKPGEVKFEYLNQRKQESKINTREPII